MSFTLSQTPNAKNEYLYPNGNDTTNLDTEIETSTFRPNADGTYTECSGDYTDIDEVVLDTNDVIYGLPGVKTSTFEIPNHTTQTGKIEYIEVFAWSRSTSNVPTQKIDAYIGSTLYQGTETNLTTSWVLYSKKWYTNPNTSARWTWTDIDNLEVGVTISEATSQGECAQIYVEVVHSTDGDNYQSADEAWNNPDDTDYVYTSETTDQSDIYTVQNSSIGIGTIKYVRVISRAKSSDNDTDTNTFKLHVADASSSTWDASDHDIFSNWAKVYSTHTTKPSSGAWDWTSIDAMKIGVKCSSNSTSYRVMVSQLFAVVNYVPAATTITLNDPKNVDCSHSRKVIRKNLPSGNYIVYDGGRNSKTLTITGTETSGAYSDMNDMKTVCHYGAKVTIAGLDDTNLNTDYWVSDIQFGAGPGYPSNVYDYKLSLEEM